ncbi:MAG: DUF3823 domain-containing protein, partial [Bacteroidales bacterium]|nr:DUF3823 domain-containing protein [Bacteroidales bacterium]
MKRFPLPICMFLLTVCAVSCELFELDNYDAPSEVLYGSVVDSKTGAPVLTDQGSEGIRVRLIETSWEGNVTPLDFYCKPDGTFRNARLFEADYNIRIDGPFVPVVIENAEGTVMKDESVNIHLKGEKEVNFSVQPFLNVEFVGSPQVSAGKITARVKVTRATSREELKAVIGKSGDWKESYANVTDVQLFVSYSSTVGYRARDSRWSSSVSYDGSSFEDLLGTNVTVKSN